MNTQPQGGGPNGPPAGVTLDTTPYQGGSQNNISSTPSNGPPAGVTLDSTPYQGNAPESTQSLMNRMPGGSNYQAPSDNYEINSGDSLGTMAQKAVGGVMAGAGEGVASTLAGASHIIGAPQSVQDTLNKAAKTGQTTSMAEKIGYGGETLAEFMLGDEAGVAGKVSSLADKYGVVSKAMKLLE